MDTKIGLIAAYDRNKLIGINNKLPWRIKDEMSFFKQTTINNVVIMGRNTYDSLNKPLINRLNIVLTSKKIEDTDDVRSFSNVLECIKFCKGLNKKIFIIGGESIYRYFLNNNVIDYMYISEINNAYDGLGKKSYFPYYNSDNWCKELILDKTIFKVYYLKKNN